jgi:hypothetical protein
MKYLLLKPIEVLNIVSYNLICILVVHTKPDKNPAFVPFSTRKISLIIIRMQSWLKCKLERIHLAAGRRETHRNEAIEGRE